MKRLGLAVLALLLAGASGCHEAADVGGADTRPAGALSYSGYDDAGVLVVTGWILLDVAGQPGGPSRSPDVRGTWSLRASVDPSRVGPQDGSGALAGTSAADGVIVDLNPERVDDNVLLQGRFVVEGAGVVRYEGTWRWVTFAGVRAEGTFRALR